MGWHAAVAWQCPRMDSGFSISGAGTQDALSAGLRLLAALRRFAPADAVEVAHAAGLPPSRAATLIDVCVSAGYVRRIGDGSLLALTPLALDLLPVVSAAAPRWLH